MTRCCQPHCLLVADIGGTHCRYALVDPFAVSFPLHNVQRAATADFSSFAELVSTMLHEAAHTGLTPDAAILAVPGSVIRPGQAICPNVPWPIDVRESPDLPASTWLINDLVAQGWACLAPEGQLLQDILAASEQVGPHSRQIQAVIGPGTGLGSSVVVSESGYASVLASELGHALFPLLPEEAGFAKFALDRGERLDGDHLVSGRGLSTLHAFFTGQERPPQEVATCMDTTPVAEWYARFLGRICQTLVLTTLCLDGLYICGGVVAANPWLLRHPAFASAFYDCPAKSAILRAVSIRLVSNTDSALCGAIICARQYFTLSQNRGEPIEYPT